jgi:hypothetical protein
MLAHLCWYGRELSDVSTSEPSRPHPSVAHWASLESSLGKDHGSGSEVTLCGAQCVSVCQHPIKTFQRAQLGQYSWRGSKMTRTQVLRLHALASESWLHHMS